MVSKLPAETEVIVVGGGPGGYVTAIRAGQLGLEVVLVTDDTPGGTCLNYGCIPSKALLSATGRVTDVINDEAERMGIYGDPYVDVGELIAWKDDIVGRLTDGVANLCASNGVKVARGQAYFADDETITVTTDQGEAEIAFEHAVVATGSRPVEIPNFSYSDEQILDSRTALSPETVPDQLVIIGAGYIGMELGFVYARLGTAVTILEALDEALPSFETDTTDIVVSHAQSTGIEFHFNTPAKDWTQEGDCIAVHADNNSYSADAILIAVGRQPVTDTIDLEEASIDLTDTGFIDVDADGRTSNEHIFAVGDVAGEPMLAHEAMAAGERTAAVIAGEEPAAPSAVPAVVFTEPEVSTVGQTEAEAAEAGYDPTVGRFPFDASGRALAAGDTDGFVRVIGDRETGRVLGGQIVGPEASELIAEVTHSVNKELTLKDISETVHSHPTFSEAVMEAAANALGKAVHTTN